MERARFFFLGLLPLFLFKIAILPCCSKTGLLEKGSDSEMGFLWPIAQRSAFLGPVDRGFHTSDLGGNGLEQLLPKNHPPLDAKTPPSFQKGELD